MRSCLVRLVAVDILSVTLYKALTATYVFTQVRNVAFAAPGISSDTTTTALLLVIRQLRIGTATLKDGGCFDFRMGVFFGTCTHSQTTT